MNVADMQIWLNNKIKENNLNLKPLVIDGIGGPATRNTVYEVFKCKNAKAVTEAELLDFAKQLGDTNTKRIKAIGKVETSGSAWTSDGTPKILYERHYFYKYVNKTIYLPGYSDHFLSNPKWGGYTQDFNKNNINDSFEKLAFAACINPIGAFSSISISSFQVMGAYYKELGYNNPLDMLYDVSRNEAVHYKLLVGFILNVAKIKSSFLKLSTNPETNRAFCKAYNGPSYASIFPGYHVKIANAMK